MQGMTECIVQPGQCLMDIAIQHLGAVDAWPELAQLNGLALTAILVPGTVLRLPEVRDKRVKRVLDEGAFMPATGDVSYLYLPEGIGYWFVEFDLIVS